MSLYNLATTCSTIYFFFNVISYKMNQYNTLNVEFSNSQLNKLISGMKNDTEITLNFSSNVIDNFNDESNFSHKLLLTNTQVSRLCKAIANGSSANIKLSKT